MNKQDALTVAGKYFDTLSATGYVTSATRKRFMAYMFLLDLVDTTFDFFTEWDYAIVDKALSRLFPQGSCLLPFKVACANRAIVGAAHAMRDPEVRSNEERTKYRATEDYTIRKP